MIRYAEIDPGWGWRLWAKVSVRPDFHWIWTGYLSSGGVPGYSPPPVGTAYNHVVSRLIYATIVGPLDPDKVLWLVCQERRCVNPDHHESVTRTEMAALVAAKITHCKRGHEFTPENTRHTRTGGRQCRMCDRDRMRRNRGSKLVEV